MNLNWEPPKHWMKVKTVDAHTGGEPLRIIYDGLPKIPGKTILSKRQYFKEHLDHIRTGLLWEPRGHADQYGAVLTEPTTSDGDIGVFFLHNAGYSTMCGHAILALGKVLPELGLLNMMEHQNQYKFDTPAGRVLVSSTSANGKIVDVSFQNVPSFVYLENGTIQLPNYGTIDIDIAFGGAFYAFCRVDQFDFKLLPRHANTLIDVGRKIKSAVKEKYEIQHPENGDLSFLYGTIFIGPAEDPSNHSRNVCIFADGELDRSPTGTGVSARSALHYFRDELSSGEEINIESILGSTMSVKVIQETDFYGHNAVIPEVSGEAFITGINEFYFDPDDPLQSGFIFR